MYRNSKLIDGRAEEARGMYARMSGLIGKKEIPDGYFLVFRNCAAIHTFFMSAEIDVLMLDNDGTVVCAKESLKPWRVLSCARARDTVEMRSGFIARLGIKAGDKITFS
jgi:hypothetical protein